MRRASQERTAQRPTTSHAPATGRARATAADRKFGDTPTSTAVVRGTPDPALGGTVGRPATTAASSTAKPPVADVLLSPAGTFANVSAVESDAGIERRRQLAIAIRQRIESRLHGRVRNLTVKIHGQTVVLEGACTTYYSKQLAQHYALGILEDEQLENAIVVEVPR
jgi:hypothetical protein